MLLFNHIPKCGGKSFRQGLKETYDEDLHLFYNNPLKKPRIKRLIKSFCPPIFAAKPKLDAVVIYGHFCFDDFRHLNSQDIQRGAFFRQPVDWAGSYLFYARSKFGHDISDPVSYIKQFRLDRAYQIFLGKTGVLDLDFVGITEKYRESLDLYSNVFGVNIPHKEKNKTKKRPDNYKNYFDELGILSDIQNLMAQNTEIYKSALKKHELLKEQNNLL